MPRTPDKKPLPNDNEAFDGPVPDDLVINHDRYLYGDLRETDQADESDTDAT